VKRFLPEPDDNRTNSNYKTGPEMDLYRISRVKRVEKTKAWCAWKEQSLKRKEAAAKAVQTKTDKLQEYVESVEITVPLMAVDRSRGAAQARRSRLTGQHAVADDRGRQGQGQDRINPGWTEPAPALLKGGTYDARYPMEQR
jgi:hypothetical protein